MEAEGRPFLGDAQVATARRASGYGQTQMPPCRPASQSMPSVHSPVAPQGGRHPIALQKPLESPHGEHAVSPLHGGMQTEPSALDTQCAGPPSEQVPASQGPHGSPSDVWQAGQSWGARVSSLLADASSR